MRCRYCDAELSPDDRVCASCGQRVAFMPNEIPAGGWARPAPAMSEAGTATTATAVLDEPAMDLAQTPENALYVDSTRLVLLLVLSSGLYIFYWTFLTWKQLARATGGQHYPVWHALTLLVPFYSLFRLHRHVSVINEVSRKAGLVPGFVAWVFVMLYIVSNILDLSYILASTGDHVTTLMVVFDVAGIAVLGAAVLWAQSNLNNFWLFTLRARLSETRFGVGELVITAVGGLSWLTYLNT
jgi:hypothetical protein